VSTLESFRTPADGASNPAIVRGGKVECYVAADASGLKKASLPVQGHEDECPHVVGDTMPDGSCCALKGKPKDAQPGENPKHFSPQPQCVVLGEQHDTIGRQIYPLGLVLCRRPHVCHAIAEYLVT
jgi:hypothetical protein